ncbi:hypothetical protein [Enterocloster citroniae]|uniref:hypothetical protein n=2 Tax=Enterocloster citroniae TaxID=358743 RepID=UPI002E77CCC7|nr:hypothetical protein [Enterocloster citroniae]
MKGMYEFDYSISYIGNIMVKLSKILERGIELCCILILGFMQLTKKEYIGYYSTRTIVIILGVIMAIAVLSIAKHDKRLSNIIKTEYRYIRIYLFLIFISSIYTLVSYNYSFKELFYVLIPYLYIFLAFPITYVFYKNGGMEKLLLRLSLFVICILICKAIAWFLFNFSDQIIFERLLFEFKDWFRNGLQRVNAGYLIGISLVMFFCKGFEQNGKLIYKIAVIFVIWFLMNITVFRFQFLTAIGTCFVVYYFLNGKELGVFTRRAILIFLAIVILTSKPFLNLIYTFSVNNSTLGNSTAVRLLCFKHYSNLFISKNPILGLGFLTSGNDSANAIMTYAGNMIYWLEDLGLLGGFFRLGVSSIYIYGALFYFAIKTCIQSLKIQGGNLKSVIWGVSAYMIVTCTMLNIFDAQRAFDVPFYLAIITYSNWKIKDIQQKKTEFYN